MAQEVVLVGKAEEQDPARLREQWAALGDVAIVVDANGRQYTDEPFGEWPAGTELALIWRWFDRFYPGGVYALLVPC